ncbi:hypothetical protein CLPU_6c00450 [Gottschalkia purinilytica]|uniref:Uncharacterized protein n=1 Tax=Gottschalkia purinilytica TaxID=1503 RepID=A0A0L0WAK9_GOTPU|nr:phage late control D family protein [Gottschalkia purinilytica]KNF08559.1 hypothetical protein CLPU_6c00450 [Gottschalkia purinilytica]
MQLIYKDTDITNEVDIIIANLVDNAGGKADSVEILLGDSKKYWRQWNPQKNDEIIIRKDGFDSGVMFIDELYIENSKFRINALSTPLDAKTKKTRSWENIRFKKLAYDIARDIGFTLETYGVEDWLYDRVDQVEKVNLEFLNERCILEGYCLKVTDEKLVIYDERKLENMSPALTITENILIGPYNFKTVNNKTYSSCLIRHLKEHEVIEYRYDDLNIYGPTLKPNIRVSNLGEAERYSKNLLRNANKKEFQGRFYIKLDTSVSAGSIVEIKDMGSFNGNYIIDSITYYLTQGKSLLNVRKILEEY